MSGLRCAPQLQNRPPIPLYEVRRELGRLKLKEGRWTKNEIRKHAHFWSGGCDGRCLWILVQLNLNNIFQRTLKSVEPELLLLERASESDRGTIGPAAQFGLQFADGDNRGLDNLARYFGHSSHSELMPLDTLSISRALVP
jgi:hypothetical protein